MIRVEINEDAISAALARLGAAVEDMTPLMQDLGELLIESTQENFRTGQSPDGVPWAPKSMATMEAYRRSEAKGLNGPVPADPLIGPSKSLSSTISYQAGPNSVDWGSNMIYAAVMQLGAHAGEFGARVGRNSKGRDFIMSIPWGDIPARPFLGIGDEDRPLILAEIEDYLRGAVGD